jgi:hypothetical protein
MKLRLWLGLFGTLAVAVWAAALASADPTSLGICSSAGTALSGDYGGNLTITGNAYVPGGDTIAHAATLNVRGNLTLAPGSCLDAFSLGTVRVGGSIFVQKGATLGLGCTPGSIGPGPPCNGQTTEDVVGGNIVGNSPLTMYLDGDTVFGNVVSNGGGPGLASSAPFVNFPIKDNTIGGNLTLKGWHGGWSGAIRNKVGGSVVWSGNMSVLDPDSNEVQTNVIAKNLVCQGNSPAAQVNPGDGGQPNIVAGREVGQCAGL